MILDPEKYNLDETQGNGFKIVMLNMFNVLKYMKLTPY